MRALCLTQQTRFFKGDMNTTFIIIIFMLLMLVIYNYRRQITLTRRISEKRRGGNREMQELAKEFIGRECLIYTFNSQLTGKIKAVTDGAVLVDNGKEDEIVNIDYIVRIREYPVNKKGKKRSVIVD